jgi:glycosyltransferase involved in cell wall biosynthesis
MRLVVDVQGLQSDGSRLRGIGRYGRGLLTEMIARRGAHEVVLLLNGLYVDTIEPLRAEFGPVLGTDAIRVWRPPPGCGALETAGSGRRRAAEIMREAVIAGLAPDAVFVLSLFEGLNESVVTGIGRFDARVPVATILYDLIPHVMRDPYLTNPVVEAWYEGKLDDLRRADLLLSISECSRQDAIRHLGFPGERIVNIAGAAADHFRPRTLDAGQRRELGDRLGLDRPFVMYTGGDDHRKNLEGLIRAFGRLPGDLRAAHRLAVVCSLGAERRRVLGEAIRAAGLSETDVRLLGHVSEDDMAALYAGCALFVFPSLYEGFGLPALEAMQSGAPTVASDTSSLPEIVGTPEALFDPASPDAIAATMARALADPDWRARLVARQAEHARTFTWARSADLAWRALEAIGAAAAPIPAPAVSARPARRPRLAYVSPVPPARSGIARYSAMLLPELARHYDVVLVTETPDPALPWAAGNAVSRPPDWLRANADRMDRVLYQFGNSMFHHHMFDLLAEVPGVAVLHDFGFGSLKAHLESRGIEPGAWSRALLRAHGWKALHDRHHLEEVDGLIASHPVNLDVIQQATGVIVHSATARDMARRWYGPAVADPIAVVPHVRPLPPVADRAAARRALGWDPDAFVVCSFGIVAAAKLHHRILAAWGGSRLRARPEARLVFAGDGDSHYGIDLARAIAASGDRVSITGWIDDATFATMLVATDVAVQLRSASRGETSGAVLDAMAVGCPVIVNAHGTLAELPVDAVVRLPEHFEDADLAAALDRLAEDADLRGRRGRRGREAVAAHHAPRVVADLYRDAIEAIHARGRFSPSAVVAAIADIPGYAPDAGERAALAEALAVNHPPPWPVRRLWLDASGLEAATEGDWLRDRLLHPPDGWRIEPIEAAPDGSGYRRADALAATVLDLPWVPPAAVEPVPGDVVLLAGDPAAPAARALRRTGVRVLSRPGGAATALEAAVVGALA